MGALEASSSSITVQWGPVDCINRNGEMIGYMVTYEQVDNTSTQKMTILNGNIGQCTISELSPGSMYEIRVAAMNTVGEGTNSHTIKGIMNFYSLQNNNK